MESINNLVCGAEIGAPARSQTLTQFGTRVVLENLLLASEVSRVSGLISGEMRERDKIDA